MEKTCLVILSHSSYSDIWEITLDSYKKNFNQSLDFYITSDDVGHDVENMVNSYGFKLLKYPRNISWSESLKYVINNYVVDNYKSVIFSFDDLVLLDKIKSQDFQNSLKLINEVDYLILNDGHNNFFSDISLIGSQKTVFRIPKNDSYVGSLVFSLWKTSFIKEIINLPDLQDVNPWQYEMIISKIFKKFPNYNFFALRKPLINFSNVIVKGKILKMEMELVERKNKVSYEGKRVYMNQKEEYKFNIYRKIFKFMRYILPHSIFKKLRKSY